MYNDTVTVFNLHKDSNGDKWYGKVLNKVDLITDRAMIVSKYGDNGQDSAKLHIKHKNGIVDGYNYLDGKEWDAESSHDNNITFRPGDFFVKGNWGNIVVNDEDYSKGYYDYMNKLSDKCYAITSVGRYDLIPHFEILAK